MFVKKNFLSEILMYLVEISNCNFRDSISVITYSLSTFKL